MESSAAQPNTSPPPAERTWTIITARRNELTGAVEADPQALLDSLAELNGILLRLGGTIQFATRRQEVEEGRIETLAVVVRWRSYSPVNKAQAAPPQEMDGTAEQVAAGGPVPAPADISDEAYVNGPEEQEPVTFESVLPPVDEPLPAEHLS